MAAAADVQYDKWLIQFDHCVIFVTWIAQKLWPDFVVGFSLARGGSGYILVAVHDS